MKTVKKIVLAAATLGLSAAHLSAYVSVNPGDLDSAGTVTWTKANNPYVLNGSIFVKGGTDLVIQPGVIIRGQGRSQAGSAGAPGSLTVTQSGTINANGSPTDPIIFTTAVLDSNSDGVADTVDDPGTDEDGHYVQSTGSSDVFLDATPATVPLGPLNSSSVANESLWGGLVILGSAPTSVGTATADQGNATAQVHHIEGLPKTTDSQYGGNITQDNSGVVRYVSVRHGGDEIGTANEINGVTLGGVGAGTLIEFVEVYCNYDDGFEFFGGTVNTNNLVVTYAGDDQFDGDQGWVGVNQYWFAAMPYFTIGSKNGDKAFEFEGDDGNTAVSAHNVNASGALAPLADYSVYNATIICASASPNNTVSANGQIDLKSRFGGAIYTSLFVDQASPAIVSLSFNSNGAHFVENSFVSDATGFVTATNTALGSADTNVSNTVTDGTAFGDPNIIGKDQTWAKDTSGDTPVDSNTLNPRFQSLAFNGTTNTILEVGVAERNSYVGAFDPDANLDLWTTGWTALNTYGVLVD